MILSLLQKNNNNFLKTETDTGIPRQTIKRWHKKYGNELNFTTYHIDIPKEQPKPEEPTQTTDEVRDQFNKAVYVVKLKLLCQLDRALTTCYSVKYLADAMKLVHDISEKTINPPEDKEGIDVFQNILNQVNNFEINTNK